MEIIEKSSKTANVQLSIEELNTFRNAINEACTGISKYAFKTRMGASREEALTLSNAILYVIEQLSLSNHKEKSQFRYQPIKEYSMQIIKIAGEQADIRFSFDELITLNNALNEVCNGIEVTDFETKIGVPREAAKLLLKSVNKLASEMRPPRYIRKNLPAQVDPKNSSSKKIREKCILETSGYQVTLFIRNLDDYKRSVGIGVMLTVNPELGGFSIKSSVTKMTIMSLQTLIFHLEDHISDLKEDPRNTSDSLYYHIFQIQALSGNVTSEDEGSFNLRFMINVKDKANRSPYVGAQAEVSFASIRSFTSSLQAVLNELEATA